MYIYIYIYIYIFYIYDGRRGVQVAEGLGAREDARGAGGENAAPFRVNPNP